MNNFFKVLMMLASSMVLAQANVTIETASYQESLKRLPSGEEVKSWIPAQKVIPGTIIRYVDRVINDGTVEATQLVINNPIPENMEYVANSASCDTGCSISYSVDNGVTFSQPEQLFVGEGEQRHLAKASEYTNIQWVVERLGANSQSSVEYKARLK